MGANNSNLKAAVVEEYNRVQHASRQFLVLNDLLTFNMPNLVQLQLTHIGVLFVMDSDQSGQYTLEKLLAFFDLCAQHARFYRPHEFQAQIQGYCALQLWNCVASQEGKATFEAWFAKLVQESERVYRSDVHPGPEFASRDTIQDMYEILSVSDHHGMSFQSFFDLLQRVGEEKGTMHLENEALDDYAPIDVLRDFASSFILGFREGLNLDALE
mmetsp:Transcript_17990/g.34372  ORF Transcript_17990/g.34372 Transcript_17990/m.34372 type:complete len:214 (+) Transcript_17990:62-703(+)|eukprot:CAMPEP_0114225934 /NCGR_PEP_ID=MMETSP0058-20121206/957_1 /TAXON_ID=36894 /ORGANISM="Pyramimonas parkeae, CCMP726" /LENGTH=213 /DNA_ID=CAMNT_0001336613 /DNA_START=327 /DNA_END=968 /DNA_ORIENTATION=+